MQFSFGVPSQGCLSGNGLCQITFKIFLLKCSIPLSLNQEFNCGTLLLLPFFLVYEKKEIKEFFKRLSVIRRSLSREFNIFRFNGLKLFFATMATLKRFFSPIWGICYFTGRSKSSNPPYGYPLLTVDLSLIFVGSVRQEN
ncbi:hypothetical protein AMTRI_Chr10g231020 [Amborella trichopoda]